MVVAAERAAERWTDEEEESETAGMVMWSKSEMEGGREGQRGGGFKGEQQF